MIVECTVVESNQVEMMTADSQRKLKSNVRVLRSDDSLISSRNPFSRPVLLTWGQGTDKVFQTSLHFRRIKATLADHNLSQVTVQCNDFWSYCSSVGLKSSIGYSHYQEQYMEYGLPILYWIFKFTKLSYFIQHTLDRTLEWLRVCELN